MCVRGTLDFRQRTSSFVSSCLSSSDCVFNMFVADLLLWGEGKGYTEGRGKGASREVRKKGGFICARVPAVRLRSPQYLRQVPRVPTHMYLSFSNFAH